MTLRDMFETEPCNRCGGCGRYSYNQRDGDRCWGCNGTGLQHTKAGAAARSQYEQATVVEMPAREVQVGWVVSLGGHRTVARFVKVAEIGEPTHAPGYGNHGNLNFRAANGSGFSCSPDSTVRRRHDAETRQAIYRAMIDAGTPGVTAPAEMPA